MRVSKYAIITAILCILLAASAANAFDGKRKGFVLGGGLGYGPLARLTIDYSSNDNYDNSGSASLNNSGPATSVLIGYAWDEHNMIVYLREAVFYKVREETFGQGFGGAAVYHYFGPVGRSFYVVGGLGLQDWFTFIDGDYESNDAGIGVLIGGGYEFARHVQIHGTVSFGSTSDLYDYTHTQIALYISAVAF
ncbi:MAG TPA: hypothetical protein PLF13_00490 [candidate division Zixibacteria bacterium]|nr:hypothetical protein [candidate division Zixibacteria bacterium]